MNVFRMNETKRGHRLPTRGLTPHLSAIQSLCLPLRHDAPFLTRGNPSQSCSQFKWQQFHGISRDSLKIPFAQPHDPEVQLKSRLRPEWKGESHAKFHIMKQKKGHFLHAAIILKKTPSGVSTRGRREMVDVKGMYESPKPCEGRSLPGGKVLAPRFEKGIPASGCLAQRRPSERHPAAMVRPRSRKVK